MYNHHVENVFVCNIYNHRVRYVFVFTTEKESLTTIRYALGGCNECSSKMCSHIFLAEIKPEITKALKDMNNINDYDNDDSGNNSRGIVVGVNHFPSFFRTLANPCFYLTAFVSKFALKYLFATIRSLKWKLNKLKLKIKEKNAII
jgi:hypothetical protein